ncbi:hypothetical protein G6F46_005142 [Rhizopus delemar]|uniref:Uncharacterized protein n=2 Tax=Rhizopus TaxID=4842 RepID=A0A9P7CMT6_9FUNG|nr:hypothetical protein G6F55_000341 [Rhizopus delemar]KAG1540383.1 hypothetical protein G6F51_008556 [Rhizopus arrhizus]KAG1496715.1 hypothetical protein G6F54_006277 [Rhizopus delemar]KAG1514388.1 hypothetical protein G6F53_003715 [Rhizopus delemar]KAG1522190.1 hypothetical protein G6F52_006075 [Rhizopus delemar]
MTLLKNKYKKYLSLADDSSNKTSKMSQLKTKASQQRYLMTWNTLPRIRSRQNSSNLQRKLINTREENEPSQERSTRSTFLNSRNFKWSPLRRLWPLPREQIDSGQQVELQQTYIKNSTTLLKTSIILVRAKNWTKMAKILPQKHYDCQKASNTCKTKTKTEKTISSHQTLLKKFNKQDLRKLLLKEQPNQNLEASIRTGAREEETSMAVEDLFLAEAEEGVCTDHKPLEAIRHTPNENCHNPATEPIINPVTKFIRNEEKTRKTTKNAKNTKNIKKHINNNPLLHSRGWDSTRKQTSSFHRKLEEDDNTNMALVRYSGRIQDPIQFKTNSVDNNGIQTFRIGSASSEQGSRFIFEVKSTLKLVIFVDNSNITLNTIAFEAKFL